MLRSKKALISVSDKAGIAAFAGELLAMGWEIVASPGTGVVLREAGYPVTDIEELTNIPAILDHRVFSEHIKIAGALVSEAGDTHDSDRAKHGIPWIDLLCVDLYPLSDVIAAGGDEREVIDSTDIGGITMIRNAVKGRRIVVTNPHNRALVIEQLKRHGDVPEEIRRDLWARAELLCSRYCLESARFISGSRIDGFLGEQSVELCYGENPYQSSAAFYDCGADEALSLKNFEQVSGDKPSYVNMTSLDALTEILSRISGAFSANFPGRVPYIAVGTKHGLPVGAAVDWENPGTALQKMFWGDPTAIWGGEVIVNFSLTEELAGMLLSDPLREKELGSGAWMLNLIVAPDADDESIKKLGKQPRRRMFVNTSLRNAELNHGFTFRNVRGGFIRQSAPDYCLKPEDIDWVGGPLTGTVFDTLLLSWGIAWSVHANGIALARDRQLLACDGQSSSVGAIKTTILKARETGHEPGDIIFAANAFLPFTDSAQLLAETGCVGGIVPRGGRNEKDVLLYFQQQGIVVAFVSEANRGFSRH